MFNQPCKQYSKIISEFSKKLICFLKLNFLELTRQMYGTDPYLTAAGQTLTPILGYQVNYF
jgi:hypothetical protein